MAFTNFDKTANWLSKSFDGAGKERDNKTFSVQLGCKLEEDAELLSSMIFTTIGDKDEAEILAKKLVDFAFMLKKGNARVIACDSESVCDALADVKVTCDGMAWIAGFDQNCADAAVLASNDAKLVNGKPVILDGGKIGKPVGWCAPDLQPFVVDSIFV